MHPFTAHTRFPFWFLHWCCLWFFHCLALVIQDLFEAGCRVLQLCFFTMRQADSTCCPFFPLYCVHTYSSFCPHWCNICIYFFLFRQHWTSSFTVLLNEKKKKVWTHHFACDYGHDIQTSAGRVEMRTTGAPLGAAVTQLCASKVWPHRMRVGQAYHCWGDDWLQIPSNTFEPSIRTFQNN